MSKVVSTSDERVTWNTATGSGFKSNDNMAMILELFTKYASHEQPSLDKAQGLAFFGCVCPADERFQDLAPTSRQIVHHQSNTEYTEWTKRGWDVHWPKVRCALQTDSTRNIDLAAFAYIYKAHGRSLEADCEKAFRGKPHLV